jgi:hypothetical protein
VERRWRRAEEALRSSEAEMRRWGEMRREASRVVRDASTLSKEKS